VLNRGTKTEEGIAISCNGSKEKKASIMRPKKRFSSNPSISKTFAGFFNYNCNKRLKRAGKFILTRNFKNFINSIAFC
jgi:hypothetical protein